MQQTAYQTEQNENKCSAHRCSRDARGSLSARFRFKINKFIKLFAKYKKKKQQHLL